MVKITDRFRKEYRQNELSEENLEKDPFRQFAHWFAAAEAAGMWEPNAMALATANRAGQPSVRMVLLKEFDERGFVFYTNYLSRKGKELAENPHAALLFWWGPLHRQIRIEGSVARVSAAESDAYFASRPPGSQIGAVVSQQSAVIPNRRVLEERFQALEEQAAGGPIPRPEHWGGYRLAPNRFEFWQGRENRLHDRFEYRLEQNNRWQIVRLSP